MPPPTHIEIGTGPNQRRLPPIKLGGNGGYDAGDVTTPPSARALTRSAYQVPRGVLCTGG